MSVVHRLLSPFRRRDHRNPVTSPGAILLFSGAGLALLYLLGATAGYAWIRFALKNEAVGFTDVALLRWKEVRRGLGAQQFARAKQAWDEKNYQAAYLAYASGLRSDPRNVEGQLAAARFFIEVGSVPLAVKVLEQGFAQTPDHRELSERLFELLLSTGRERRALELLQRRLSSGPATGDAVRLRTYEVQATLGADGAKAARALLEKHPELEKTPASAPVVARVWWETQDRLKAIGHLADYVRTQPGNYATSSLLCTWYLSASMPDKAQELAEQVCRTSPSDLAPRILLIEVVAARSFQGREWMQAVESYLADFKDRPESIPALALLSGRKGWVDLARQLYAWGAMRLPDLRLLALAYSDALIVNRKFKEAQEALVQIEAQAAEESAGLGQSAFLQQVRQRQVMMAAALGDEANVREHARRLVASLRNDPHQLEANRRMFERRGITLAVAEFTVRPPGATAAARK